MKCEMIENLIKLNFADLGKKQYASLRTQTIE